MSNSKKYRAAVVTISDKGSKGEREDVSGNVIKDMLVSAGYAVAYSSILPDEKNMIEAELKRLCDNNLCDLIFTTGGTGFSQRDVTPEATLAVAERLAPGISEAMRESSMKITKRAMLSRGVSVIRRGTLIVNLPGSPKSAKESLDCILETLVHGIAILKGEDGECAR